VARLVDVQNTPELRRDALVALDKDELQLDGILDENGEVDDDQPMHIQRVGEGAYLVRAVTDNSLPELSELI